MTVPDSEVMAILRTRIKKLLQARNLTIKEVAESSGIKRESLSRMLSGHFDCTLTNAERLAKTLGLTLSELISPEEIEKKSA